MAVLLQKVIPSEYAFVIHTADPISGDRSKIFGEVVAGLGEVLVGSYPGRAFSFTYNEDGRTGEPLIFAAFYSLDKQQQVVDPGLEVAEKIF
jgi:hypothetical protein